MNEKSPGQIGYEAYGADVGWTSVSGLPMPTWDELPWKIKNAWNVAAHAARDGVQPLSNRQLEIIYAATSGSAGWRYDQGELPMFFDISGRQIEVKEYNDALGELYRIFRHA